VNDPNKQKFQEAWETILQAWRPDFEPRLLMFFQIGSHSHGTYIAPTEPDGIDDIDFLAIVLPPMERVLGLNRWEHAEVKQANLDVVIYSWGKYVGLLRKSNPNVLGTLWIDESDLWAPEPSETWRELRANRNAFVSKEAAKSFHGYVRDQLHKMTHCAGQGFLGRKRKELVERFGFDVKNAAHAIRLCRMCHEFLTTGAMNVKRPDASELMQIKRGEWKLDRVIQEAQNLKAACESAELKCSLPDHPDLATIDRIIIDGYLRGWERQSESNISSHQRRPVR